MPTLPARDPRDVGPKSGAKQFTVTLPAWLVEKVEEIAKVEKYTRNATVREILRQFADNWDAERAAKKAAK